MNHEVHEGPARFYLPICVLTPLGFIGGPRGYMEVGEDEKGREFLIVTESDNASVETNTH